MTIQNLWLSIFLSYFSCHPKEPVTKQTLISHSLDNFAKKPIAAALAASFEAPTVVCWQMEGNPLLCKPCGCPEWEFCLSFKTCFQSNELSLWKSNKLGATCQENEAVCLKFTGWKQKYSRYWDCVKDRDASSGFCGLNSKFKNIWHGELVRVQEGVYL